MPVQSFSFQRVTVRVTARSECVLTVRRSSQSGSFCFSFRVAYKLILQYSHFVVTSSLAYF